MLTMYKFILSILSIGKKYLIIILIVIRLHIIFYKNKLIYHLVVDYSAIQQVDYVRNIRWRVCQTGFKY